MPFSGPTMIELLFDLTWHCLSISFGSKNRIFTQILTTQSIVAEMIAVNSFVFCLGLSLQGNKSRFPTSSLVLSGPVYYTAYNVSWLSATNTGLERIEALHEEIFALKLKSLRRKINEDEAEAARAGIDRLFAEYNA